MLLQRCSWFKQLYNIKSNRMKNWISKWRTNEQSEKKYNYEIEIYAASYKCSICFFLNFVAHTQYGNCAIMWLLSEWMLSLRCTVYFWLGLLLRTWCIDVQSLWRQFAVSAANNRQMWKFSLFFLLLLLCYFHSNCG